MRPTLLFLLATLLLPPCVSHAEDTKPVNGVIYFNNVPPSEILTIYAKLTGLELVTDSRAKAYHYSVSYRSIGPVKSKAEVVQDLEKALREQAGIVITKLDDKQVSVTFNDALPITPVTLPAQK